MIRPFTDAVSRLRQRREQAQQRQTHTVPVGAPVQESAWRPGDCDLWVTEHMVLEILEANDLADQGLDPVEQTQEDSQQ
jgi:hypothetical protein